MPRGSGLFPSGLRDLRLALESGDRALLGFDGAVQQRLRVVEFRHRLIVLPPLVAPTKSAVEIAGVNGRGHLDAAVALDPVETPLVAVSAVKEGLTCPVTGLHGAVPAD